MKIILAIIVFYLITLTGFSQTRELSDQPIDQVVHLINAKNPRYSNTEGSPYLNEAFLPAKINSSKQTKFVRFNSVDNTIEVLIDSTKSLILSKSDSYKINFLGRDRVKNTKPSITKMTMEMITPLFLSWYTRAKPIHYTLKKE